MTKKKSLFILIIAFLVLINLMTTCSFAVPMISKERAATYKIATINTDDYDPSKNPIEDKDIEAVTGKVGGIYSTILTVGIIISVIALIVIGIKYMTGTVVEKAEYKKTMIPYIIGVVFMGSIAGILKIIIGIAEDFNV